MRRFLLVLLAAALLIPFAPFVPVMPASAQAVNEYAPDLTTQCRFTVDRNRGGFQAALDGDYKTLWKSGGASKGFIRFDTPKNAPCGGVYIQWLHKGLDWEVQRRDEKGKWATVAKSETRFLADFLPLPPTAGSLRIRASKRSGVGMQVVELRVFGPGEPPPEIQRWQPPLEKADLLLIHAHPDDEVLFMGGVLPYYAGERQMRVQTLCLVPTMYYRKLELLDSLWHCGVRNYPLYGTMGDNYAQSLEGMYKRWSRNKLYALVTEAVRRFRPDVVVTHDQKGEYGHGAHRAAADAAIRAIGYAADKKAYPKSAKAYGLWSVKKLYIHLYAENALRMDWRAPLAYFGGKTAFDVACEAYALHVSQGTTEYHVEDFGPYDNSLFGLYHSSVGPDEARNDFFEHILPTVEIVGR